MPVLPRSATTLMIAVSALAVSGCGGTQAVKRKAIAFEPTIIGCSGNPTECTSATGTQIRELREAHNHLCPEDKPNVLVKADGALVCVATLPSARPSDIGIPIPSGVRAHGVGAVANFKAGEAVVARTGCLACHRIAEAGNSGPGSDLTHVGSRLPPAAIERALVDSSAPMPSFRRLPNFQRRALVDFLTRLR